MNHKTTRNPEFLIGGGEMGTLIQSFNWSATPLGNFEIWSQSLKTSIYNMLRSSYPTFIWWGKDLITFHNDAFIPLSDKNQSPLLGQSARTVWSEIWEQLSPVTDQVLAGQQILGQDLRLSWSTINLSEDTSWIFSYSPIFEEDGSIGGIISTGYEQTGQVIAQQQTTEVSERLLELEKQIRLVADNVPALVSYVDAAHHYQFVNKNYTEWFDLKPEDIVGKHIREVLGEAAYATVLPAIERVLAGEKFTFERLIPYKGLGERFIQVTYVPDFNPVSQKVQGYYALVQDISERKRNEEALRTSNTQIKELLESIGAVFYAFDENFHFSYVNQKAEEIYGIPREEIVGKPILEVLPQAAGTESYRMHLQAMQERRQIQYETLSTVLHRWISVSIFPRESGGLSVYFHDIHERKLAEEALRESQETLHLAMRSGRMGTWTRNLITNEVTWSKELEELFGLPSAKFGGFESSFFDLIFAPDREKVAGEVERALTEHTDYLVEFRFHHADGSLRWMEGRGRAVYAKTGEPLTLYGIGIDITERKRLEQERERFLDLGSDLQVLTGLDGYFKWVSPAFERLLGWTQEEMTTKPWTVFVHPDDIGTSEEETDDLFKGKKTFAFENRYRQKDGSYRWLQWNAQTYPEENIIYGTAIDITERKRQERHNHFLLEISKALSLLSDTEDMMEVVARELGTYLDISRCLFAEYQWDQDKAIIHYDWSKDAQNSIAGVYRISDFASDEGIQSFTSGKQFVVNDTSADPRTANVFERLAALGMFAYANAPYNSGGVWRYTLNLYHNQPHQWQKEELTLLQDVCNSVWPRIERARAEAALRYNENQLRLVTDAMPVLISYVDQEQRYRFVNRTYMEWFGVERDQILGKHLREVIGDSAYKSILPNIQKVLSGQEIKSEQLLHYKNAGSRHVNVNNIPDIRANGEIKGYYGFVQDITKRKLAEEARRESEERYHSLFYSIDEGFCVCEMLFDENNQPIDYLFLEVNPMYKKLTGLANPVGKTGRELVPNLEEKWFEIYGEVVSTGKPIRFESHLAAWDKWYYLLVSPLGKPEERKFAILFNDITERKQAETRLRESEKRLQQMADAMPQLVWIADAQGKVNYYNNRVKEMDGIVQTTPGHWEWQPVLHPEDAALTMQVWQKSVEQKEVYALEHRIQMKNGGYRWHLSRALPVFDNHGEVLRWYGTATDIHDLKQTEQALAASEQHFRNLTDAAPVLIWQAGLDKGCYYLNKGWLEFTGRTLQQEQGNGWADGVHPADFERCLEVYTGAFDRRKSFTMEYRLRRYDGEYRWLLDHGVPTYDHNGVFSGFIGTCVDIHEKKTDEEQKDAFMSIAGHELRTPLTSLIGYLNLLLKDENTRTIHTSLKKSYSSALKMRSLINDFLYFTGPRPGQIPFEISEFSFNNLVTETIENFHLSYPHINIQVQGEATATIKGDRGRIEQVIANLLNNAIKYAPGKNQIDVILKQENDNVVLQVRDYGIGIEPEEISLLFDKFYRAGNTGKIKGMGLGLYIVREIVSFHKGKVLVENAPEEGTIFTVKLPIV